MIAALPSLPAEVSITHQTGPADLDRVRDAYAAANRAGRADRVESYLSNMSEEYARCHIVVSRAGATTCAELAAAGRGALLIPLELAGGHQRYNARALADAGAAEVIFEADLNGDLLATRLSALSRDPQRYIEMGRRARRNALPDATKAIADKLDELLAR
jgi:UDP-N-acetylglucosamine--N-acetylmuramyl-(pentapeptide) pyrophosphoryl-undecaprenol N-acetylglucosamine transferase